MLSEKVVKKNKPLYIIYTVGLWYSTSYGTAQFCLYHFLSSVNMHNTIVPTNMSQKRSGSPKSSGHEAKKKHWSLGLLDTMNDPKEQVMTDDKVIVIRDKYPKAKFHYLVLPREKIASLSKLEKTHVSLLKHMEMIGKVLVDRHPDSTFMMGYHAVPSMHHLHMHVISDDFVSPALKTKKHWNSFNTDHFILSSRLIKSLEETGKPLSLGETRCSELLDSPLQCHKCSYAPKNIPNLKEHLLGHLKKSI